MNCANKIMDVRRYIVLPLSILLLFIQPSCKKLVQTPAPSDKLVTPSVFSNNATANQAQLSIYAYISANSESFHMSQNCGLLADEFKNYVPSGTPLFFYKNAMSSSMSVSDGCWQNAYTYIYAANAIIEGLRDNKGVDAIIASRLTAESKFVRAFWHFYLTLCYGDVPLALTTDYTVNTSLSRSSRADVLKQIIADLQDAKGGLTDNFLDVNDTAISTERLRPSGWAAHALLSRAYLYAQKYDSAEAEATAVINHTSLFTLLTDLTQVFLANSKEAIWQNMYPLPSSTNTPDGDNYILTSAPSGTSVSLSNFLLTSFETGDNRKNGWINSIATPTVYYYPFKYKINSRSNSNPDVHTEYIMVLRLAEQYLIRAEARAQQNNLQGAIDDVNYLRLTHGGLTTPLPVPNSQAAALATVLHERQVELFTEWGHRWFDLARMGAINTVMGSVTPAKGSTWDASGYQQLFPIPQEERARNPHLTQNPGYF